MAPANAAAWWLFQQLQPLLLDGYGGVSGAGLEAGLNILGVPPAARPELYRKLTPLISAWREGLFYREQW